MSSDIYSDQAISTSTHTLSLCKYVAHCMLNTRWPGDGPPLKRLFGTKLKTVYLKKQVYNSARWIAGSGWRGRGDGDAGTLAVLRACGPPGGGTAAARAAFSLPGPAAAGGGGGRHTREMLAQMLEMLEMLEALGRGRGGCPATVQQGEHRSWEGPGSQGPAPLCPAIDLGRFLSSLIHSSNTYQAPARCIHLGIQTRKSGTEFGLSHLAALCLNASPCPPSEL